MVYKICYRTSKQTVNRKLSGYKTETHKSCTCTIPEAFLDRIGVSKDNRLVDVSIKDDTIIITKVKED
jgi:hypothetical protein